jgi:hypothetical protein
MINATEYRAMAAEHHRFAGARLERQFGVEAFSDHAVTRGSSSS